MEAKIRNLEDVAAEELQLEVMSLLVEALSSKDASVRVGAINILSKLAGQESELAPFIFDALGTKK